MSHVKGMAAKIMETAETKIRFHSVHWNVIKVFNRISLDMFDMEDVTEDDLDLLIKMFTIKVHYKDFDSNNIIYSSPSKRAHVCWTKLIVNPQGYRAFCQMASGNATDLFARDSLHYDVDSVSSQNMRNKLMEHFGYVADTSGDRRIQREICLENQQERVVERTLTITMSNEEERLIEQEQRIVQEERLREQEQRIVQEERLREQEQEQRIVQEERLREQEQEQRIVQEESARKEQEQRIVLEERLREQEQEQRIVQEESARKEQEEEAVLLLTNLYERFTPSRQTPVINTPPMRSESQTFRYSECVQSNFWSGEKRAEYHVGIITAIHTNGMYDIYYNDGTSARHVHSKYIKKYNIDEPSQTYSDQSYSRSYSVIDHNDDFCSKCKQYGELVCCDHCNRSYHKQCDKKLSEFSGEIPENFDYVCLHCERKRKLLLKKNKPGRKRYACNECAKKKVKCIHSTPQGPHGVGTKRRLKKKCTGSVKKKRGRPLGSKNRPK